MKRLAVVAALTFAACDGGLPFTGETATVPIEQGYGPTPTLPPPNPT